MAATDANIAVRIGADISPLQRDMTTARRELKGFESTAKNVASKIATLGAAAGVAAAAFGAMSIAAANNARELTILASISGTSAEAFQVLARQTKTVGIEQEQLGDILKDTREKLGEFIATGGGGFADFAERFGLSAAEVRDQFQSLTGPQILGKMQRMMSDLNIPLEQQIFMFESVASESSKLLPIFRDLNTEGSALAKNMGDIVLSEEELENLTKMGDAFQSLTDNVGSLIERFIALAAPDVTTGIKWLNNLFRDLNENVLPETNANVKAIGESLGAIGGDDEEWITISKGLMPFELSDVEDYLTAIHEIYSNHYSAINQLSRAHANAQEAIIIGSALDIASSLESQSKKAFEFMKAVRVSEAVINGYGAATAAWKQGMEIGGPPVAAAFTAASLVRTAALVNSIKSTGMKSGGGGGGGSSSVGTGGAVDQARPQNQIVTINLEGEVFGRDQVRGLIGKINDALDDGYSLRI